MLWPAVSRCDWISFQITYCKQIWICLVSRCDQLWPNIFLNKIKKESIIKQFCIIIGCGQPHFEANFSCFFHLLDPTRTQLNQANTTSSRRSLNNEKVIFLLFLVTTTASASWTRLCRESILQPCGSFPQTPAMSAPKKRRKAQSPVRV